MKGLSKASFGTTPQTFENAMRRALAEGAPARRPRRAALVLVMGILIVALACTALAVGISRSAQYSAVSAAREALYEAYGLTPETLSAFVQIEARDGERWTIEWRPAKYNLTAMGEYAATVGADGGVQVSWTHDGKSLTPEDGFDAEVWGQPQLEAALAIDAAYYQQMQEINWDEAHEWTLEERARMDEILAQAGKLAWVVRVAPGPDDLTEEEAVALAREQVLRTYGVTPDYLDALTVGVDLYKYQDEDEKQYRIYFTRDGEDGVSLEHFYVSFSAQTQQGMYTAWGVEPEYRTLPEGDLSAYEDAAREFVEEGAFALASVADKADIAARMQAAGFGDLLPYGAYAAPQDGDISQARALEGARAALDDAFGLTPQALTLFEESVALIERDGARLWAVDYTPVWQDFMRLYVQDLLGDYQVLLAAADGNVVEAEWSLMGEWPEGAVYTEATWGEAPVLHASLLPWVMELMEIDRHYLELFMANEWPDLPVTEAAALAGAFRARGFPAEQYSSILPGDGDITEDEALAIARETLFTDFGIAHERSEGGSAFASFYLDAEGRNVWHLRVWPAENTGQEDYSISIDAATGEVLRAENIGVGNG